MYLTRLSLAGYRNYASLDLSLAPGVSLFLGANAQGKTNLLESIYFLATTRTSRAGNDLELIRRAEWESEMPVARVAGWAQRRRGAVEVEISVVGTRQSNGADGRALHGNKRLRVNGVPRRASEVVGQIAAVLFTAQDIELLTGAPSQRRRYLDLTLSQVNGPYLRSLQRYSRVLLQRNSLLRRLQDGLGRGEQLSFWDQELVREAAVIFNARAEAVAPISRQAAEHYEQLSGGRERLEITYAPQLPPGAERECLAAPLAQLQETLLAHLRPRQRQEIAAGASLYGPHRDDVSFAIDGLPAAGYGSRAQQRSAALALRLAEMRYIEEQIGDTPVLLLDDILSELDERHRHATLDGLRYGEQVLLTATETDRLSADFLARAQHYLVESGHVTLGTPR